MLPKLQKLDNAAVSEEERIAAKSLNLRDIENEECEIIDPEEDVDVDVDENK